MMWMCNDDQSVDESLGKHVFISNQLRVSMGCWWGQGVRGVNGCQWGFNENGVDV